MDKKEFESQMQTIIQTSFTCSHISRGHDSCGKVMSHFDAADNCISSLCKAILDCFIM